MKTGDRIAEVARPIAKTIDYFFNTNIQHCAGCKRMQNNLNAGMNLADAIYNRFWPSSNNNGENKMQFIVTKQISVEAETPEEAVAKSAEGRTISVSANPRPEPQIAGRPVPTPTIRPQYKQL